MTHSSRKPETYDVIVVGFGAAGAAAAIEAADRGATVLVLDRTEADHDHVVGLGLS